MSLTDNEREVLALIAPGGVEEGSLAPNQNEIAWKLYEDGLLDRVWPDDSMYCLWKITKKGKNVTLADLLQCVADLRKRVAELEAPTSPTPAPSPKEAPEK